MFSKSHSSTPEIKIEHATRANKKTNSFKTDVCVADAAPYDYDGVDFIIGLEVRW